MKTTLRIFVAAFLAGMTGLTTHAHTRPLTTTEPHFSLVSPEPHFSLASAGAHFSLVSAVEPTEMRTGAYALTHEQAMQILSAAHAQYWHDEITLAELVQRYEDGICTIDPVPNGYKVNGGGSLGSVLIIDSY